VSQAFNIRVESYAGHKGEERPTRFFLGGKGFKMIEIHAILMPRIQINGDGVQGIFERGGKV